MADLYDEATRRLPDKPFESHLNDLPKAAKCKGKRFARAT